METLDAQRVAFVSVTQQFNTATSMGRLVLHILRSFAQFEREMIAERVREIIDLYLRERSLIATAAELGRRGWTLKSWVTRKGRARQGRPFDKCNLFGLLTNVIYIGQVNYKGTIYPGKVRRPSPFNP